MTNYCYMTLLTNDDYLPGVILLNQSLRGVKSKYPLVCLITNDLSPETLEILRLQGITTDKVENIASPERIYNHNKDINTQFAEVGKDTFTKFHIWRYTQFDKIIFLDADLLILKNLDHCFEMPDMSGAIDGEYFNLWPKYKHLNSGFFVFKPNIKVYSDLMQFIYSVDPNEMVDYLGLQRIIADQDVIVEYFKDGGKEKQVSKYYNIFAPYILKENEKDIIDNGYFIHFVGCKPWVALNNRPAYMYDTGLEFKSKLFYNIAQGVISYVYKHNFKNIDGDSSEFTEVLDEIVDLCLSLDNKDAAIKICKFTNYHSKLDSFKEEDDYNDRKKILHDMFVYFNKNKIFSNAYVFEIINKLDKNDKKIIDDLGELIYKPMENIYGKL